MIINLKENDIQSQEDRSKLDGLVECVLCIVAQPVAQVTGGTQINI